MSDASSDAQPSAGATGGATADATGTTTGGNAGSDGRTVNVAGERGPHGEGVPVVVRLVCLLGLLTAALTFFAGVYYWWQAPVHHTLGGAALLLLAAGKGGTVYGLWHAREWAWIVAMVLFPVAIVVEFLRLLSGDPSATYAIIGDFVVLGYVSKHKRTYAPDLRILPE